MTTVTPESLVAEFPTLTFAAVLTGDDFKPGCRGGDGQNHWKVTIGLNGRTFSTDYHQGAGHRNYKGKPIPYGCKDYTKLSQSRPNVPTVTDVLACLTSDAGCVDGTLFEDFCSEFGYDTDSRKAEQTYRACCDTFMALRNLGFRLDRLQELFQDY